jgi:hypothetical protein
VRACVTDGTVLPDRHTPLCTLTVGVGVHVRVGVGVCMDVGMGRALGFFAWPMLSAPWPSSWHSLGGAAHMSINRVRSLHLVVCSWSKVRGVVAKKMDVDGDGALTRRVRRVPVVV